MPNEWIVYTQGARKYLENIRDIAMSRGSDFEWKIVGSVLYFRPKTNVPDFMNVEFK